MLAAPAGMVEAGYALPAGAGDGADAEGAGRAPSLLAGRLTDEQIDAAIAASLLRGDHVLAGERLEGLPADAAAQAAAANARTAALRACLSPAFEPPPAGQRFAGEAALVAALKHALVDVAQHGARAFCCLAKKAPTSLAKQLEAEETLVWALRKHERDAQFTRHIAEGLAELRSIGRDGPSYHVLADRRLLEHLATAVKLHAADAVIVRLSLGTLDAASSARHRWHLTPSVYIPITVHAALVAVSALQFYHISSDCDILCDGIRLIDAATGHAEAGAADDVDSLREAGAIAVLVQALQRPQPEQVTTSALSALSNILRHRRDAAGDVIEGIVESLPHLLLRGDAGAGGTAAQAQERARRRLVPVATSLVAQLTECVTPAAAKDLLRAKLLNALAQQFSDALESVNLDEEDRDYPSQHFTILDDTVCSLEQLCAAAAARMPTSAASLGSSTIDALTAACMSVLHTVNEGASEVHVAIAACCCRILSHLGCVAAGSPQSAVLKDGVITALAELLARAMADSVTLGVGACRTLTTLLPKGIPQWGCTRADRSAAQTSGLAAIVHSRSRGGDDFVCGWAACAQLQAVAVRSSSGPGSLSICPAVHVLADKLRSCEEVTRFTYRYGSGFDTGAGLEVAAAEAVAAFTGYSMGAGAFQAGGGLTSLHARPCNIGHSAICALLGPAADNEAFASAALETVAALTAAPHYRRAMLQLEAVSAVTVAVGWHSATATVCKSACDALSNLAFASVPRAPGTIAAISVERAWLGVLRTTLARHGHNDAVTVSALRAAARLVIAHQGCNADLAASIRAATEASMRRAGCSSDVSSYGSLLFAALHLTDSSSHTSSSGDELESSWLARSEAASCAMAALPRIDRNQSINACAWLAAAVGDMDALTVIAAAPVSRPVQWAAFWELAAHSGQQALLDFALERLIAPGPTLYGTGRYDAADRALAVQVARGDCGLVRHLLHRWDARPEWEHSAALWLAMEQHSVEMLDLLLEGLATAAGAGRSTIHLAAVVDVAAKSGHLELLERLALRNFDIQRSWRLSCRSEVDVATAALDAPSESRLPVHLIQRMLLDTCADPEAAGQQALAAAAAQKRLFIMQALLEDPRVDPLPVAAVLLVADLEVALDPDVCSILLRQPALAHRFALPAADATAAALLRQYAYSAADAAAMCAAAWRRRRAAVLAWISARE